MRVVGLRQWQCRFLACFLELILYNAGNCFMSPEGGRRGGRGEPGQQGIRRDVPEKPRFEDVYGFAYLHPGKAETGSGSVVRFSVYRLLLPLGARRGQEALARFTEAAAEAGYTQVAEPTVTRDVAVSSDRQPVSSLTFFLATGEQLAAASEQVVVTG